MRRLGAVFLAIIIVALMALAFGYGFTLFWRLDAAKTQEVLALYALAAAAASLLFLTGQIFGAKGHGYYVIMGGVVFLLLDVMVWRRFDIMPAVKFSHGGFIPAGILGVFLGPIYRIVAIPNPVLPRDPLP